MIVVDSSAILAVLFSEPETKLFEQRLRDDDRCLLSAVNAHEVVTVLRVRRGHASVLQFWRLVEDFQIEIVAFDVNQVHVAGSAFDRFGKGIHSRARLNVCDCAAYALAKTTNAPLLFKGDDFSHTDIVAAV